jgi:cyclohexadienyl dehydratase
MDPFERSGSGSRRISLAIGIALVAALLSIFALALLWRDAGRAKPLTPSSLHIPSMLERINKDSVLHAGYGVTPPYTIEDPNTKAVSGYTVDIVERIAKDWKVKVVWHRLNWNTFMPDIKRGEFDMIGEPIFMTVPRARELGFSDPIDYFPEGVVMVRKGEKRFQNYEDLNKPDVNVGVQMGFASETIARAKLPRATITAVAPGTDQLQLFNEVVAGRVDATSSEGGLAQIFLKEHSSVVKLINADHPAAWVPGAFAFRFEDTESARAFSVGLRYLRLTGELDALRQKWGLPHQVGPQ